MPEEIITFAGQKAKVACDGNCEKAWGIQFRPRNEKGEYLKDNELGAAPADPAIYEGNDAKPKNVSEFPNKWCVRQCERCSMSWPGQWHQPLRIKTF